MPHPSQTVSRWAQLLGRVLVAVTFTVGVAFLLLWLAGRFEPKVTPSAGAAKAVESPGGVVIAVRRLQVPLSESAVGTIRAVHETSLGSKLMARVVEAKLKAGQKVAAGEVLVRLDDTDLRAKLQQAEAAAAMATAAQAQAILDEKRFGSLVKSKAVSQQEYDRTLTALRSADAELRRTQEVVNEVRATLDWATVRAPMDAVVIDKRVDVGDMVVPGQILVTLFDPSRMQLVASVRESLTQHLQVGQSIPVRLEGLNKTCGGTISEIVPEAQSASRSFQVKVTGPCPSGIYTGMFGRILIPLASEQVLVIPRRAVRHVGQLDLVEVLQDGQPTRRAIRVGRKIPEEVETLAGSWTGEPSVEVLSGLREGEQVILRGAAVVAQEANHG